MSEESLAALYRLVPRKGAGPDLRSEGGGKIDEYLMRLLRTGTVPTDANHGDMGEALSSYPRADDGRSAGP